MHLIIGVLMKMGGMEPKIIRTGNKLYEVLLKRKRLIHPYISFRDTFNWMTLKLEELPKALALDIDAGTKDFFPHGWNQNRYMHVRLPHLPDRHFYYPESMTKQRLAKFNEFYAANRSKIFCLGEKIGPYCEQVNYAKI